jgi:hypothetical protein
VLPFAANRAPVDESLGLGSRHIFYTSFPKIGDFRP